MLELSLENIDMESNGAKDGRIWIFRKDNDEMCFIRLTEVNEVIKYLEQFKK